MILGPASALAFPSLSIYTGNSLIKALLSYANHLSHKEYCSHTHLCKGHAVGLILHTTHDRWRRIQTWEFHSIWIDRRLKKRKRKKNYVRHGVYHQKPHRQLTGGNSYQKMADGRGDLTRGRAAAEGRRRRKGEVRLDRGAAVVRWRAECWEMLKVLQSNMHLRIWGMKMQVLWTSISKYEVYKRCNFQVYLHLPCFLFSSISIRFSLRFSSLAFFCLRRFLFSKSSKGLKDDLFHLRNLYSKTLKKKNVLSVLTCKHVQSFLGQDWWLQC